MIRHAILVLAAAGLVAGATHAQSVTDLATGLMWRQTDWGGPYSCEEALGYIEKLNSERFAGYDNWRLPTAEEIHSVMESVARTLGHTDHRLFFPEGKDYWLADSFAGARNTAWEIQINTVSCYPIARGYDKALKTAWKLHVLAVRTIDKRRSEGPGS